MPICYLCKQSEFKIRPGKIRPNSPQRREGFGLEKIQVLECIHCHLVFLSSFEHMNESFYNQDQMDTPSPMSNWIQATEKDDQRRFEKCRPFIGYKKVLDVGCGNGGFLVRSRPIAEKVAGVELHSEARAYLKSQDIEIYSHLSEVKDRFDVITLFHVLEHISDPRTFLQALKEKLNPGGKLIVEVPNSEDALLTLFENPAFQNFTYWECHLFLFNSRTLKMLADQANLKLIALEHIQRYPLSNHLHWLSRSAPGGHEKWSFLDSDDLTAAYHAKLASLGISDTLFATLSA